MSFIKISKRSQFFLLGTFLEEPMGSTFGEEIDELLEHGYLNPDFTISKKGEAYCHIQNYVGVNFQELVRNNSKKANTSLACEVLSHIAKSGVKDIKILSKSLDEDVKSKIVAFFYVGSLQE